MQPCFVHVGALRIGPGVFAGLSLGINAAAVAGLFPSRPQAREVGLKCDGWMAAADAGCTESL
jgi:hypothetical protein